MLLIIHVVQISCILFYWFALKEYSLDAYISLLLPKQPTSHHMHTVLIAVDHDIGE